MVEFGFPVQLLPVVRVRQRSGAAAWWFTGDAAACLSDWRASWRAAMPDEIWQRQYDAIVHEWAGIALVYGANVLETRPAHRHLTPEEITAVIMPAGQAA